MGLILKRGQPDLTPAELTEKQGCDCVDVTSLLPGLPQSRFRTVLFTAGIEENAIGRASDRHNSAALLDSFYT